MNAGARRWIQTTDIRPRKPALYPLSYPRMLWLPKVGKPPNAGVWDRRSAAVLLDEIWQTLLGSNQRQPESKSGALPTELRADKIEESAHSKLR